MIYRHAVTLNCVVLDIIVNFYFLQKIDEAAIEDFYGLTSDLQKTSESGYILFYQSRE